MSKKEDQQFMLKAIEFAQQGMDNNEGGPFGAIIVKDGKIVGRGNNKVTSTNDPTAHAEVVAIRDACKNLGTFQLDDCVIYTSCEPCPMCLGAIYWARPKRIVFACDKKDAAAIGFDDDFIYKEIELSIDQRSIPTSQLLRDQGIKVFKNWEEKTDKDAY
jgi:tRNA(Arg) A34 adenosine deaminase TadA